MSQVAFIFPGQGSPSVGIGKELADNFKVARETFQEEDDTLKFSISSLCFNGPEEELKLTPNAGGPQGLKRNIPTKLRMTI